MRGIKHFFPVPPLRTAELTIRGMGIQEHMPPGMIDRPTGTGDYLLMLFYGDITVGVAGKPVGQPRNTMMIWPSGQGHYYGDRTRPFTHTWIHCDGTFIRSLLRKTGLPCNRPFVVPDPAVMERNLLAIHEELTLHARPDGVIVRNFLENWLRETARMVAQREEVPGIPSQFLALRHFIESEYERPIKLPELAKRVNLSVPHFCTEFKRYFGTSAKDYLIRQRMHQAAYLMKDRNLRVSEVAQRVGYEDLYYFSRLFRKHYGVSPRGFRAKVLPG
ncbi:MAG: AraC family transcriptional regulator [bacterium]|jgi:AraC family transcriptional regulator of arabinose operon